MATKPARTWKELPLVEVVWVDAAADLTHEGSLNDPRDAEKFGGLIECRDVGYLIRKNRKEIVLAAGVICDEDGYRHSNTVPRGWVKRIIVLSRPEEP